MTNPLPERSGERIAKLLARAGVASRREVERMIAEGRVKIGGVVVGTPATVLESLKGVTVDDIPVKTAEAPRLYAFHKPAGLLTTEQDPAGRPTIYTALRNALPKGSPRLMPVGRLDLNTEGLLLLTNDGELKRAMELPASGIPRTYRARTFGDISQAQLETLIEGVTIDGMHYSRIDANLERRTGRNQWVEMTLTEGKNREVRRVLEHLGLQVSRLIRTAYGPFALADLPRGMAVELRQVDVERFRKALGQGSTGEMATVAFAAPAREREASPARRTAADAPKQPKPDNRPRRPGKSPPSRKPFAPRGSSEARDTAEPRNAAEPRNSRRARGSAGSSSASAFGEYPASGKPTGQGRSSGPESRSGQGGRSDRGGRSDARRPSGPGRPTPPRKPSGPRKSPRR